MIEQHPADAADLPESKTIAFVMSESSTIKIKSFRRYYYSPLFEISGKLPLDVIYIGSERANPASHSFKLSQEDRHGMAWFDLNDDGAMDVVIAKGGQGGQIRGPC
jgi:hypothetical protein